MTIIEMKDRVDNEIASLSKVTHLSSEDKISFIIGFITGVREQRGTENDYLVSDTELLEYLMSEIGNILLSECVEQSNYN